MDAAAVRVLQRSQGAHQGRFARPVGPQQPVHATRNCQRDMVEGLDPVLVGLGEVFNTQLHRDTPDVIRTRRGGSFIRLFGKGKVSRKRIRTSEHRDIGESEHRGIIRLPDVPMSRFPDVFTFLSFAPRENSRRLCPSHRCPWCKSPRVYPDGPCRTRGISSTGSPCVSSRLLWSMPGWWRATNHSLPAAERPELFCLPSP